LLFPPTDIALSNAFLAIKTFFIIRKITEETNSKYFAFSALLHLFYTSNFAVFVGGSTKIFIALGAGYPCYATATSFE